MEWVDKEDANGPEDQLWLLAVWRNEAGEINRFSIARSRRKVDENTMETTVKWNCLLPACVNRQTGTKGDNYL